MLLQLPGARAGLANRRLLTAARAARRRCACVLVFDLHAEIVPYFVAWDWQKQRVERLAGGPAGRQEAEQALLILQHATTYTLGTRSSLAHLKFLPEESPFPLVRTERGGEVTYHGPGQLTLYPILDLTHFGKDLHAYLRNLEEVVIRALHLVSGIEGFRIEGLSGVWTSSGKIAAVGVRATRWVTYHGIALNVNPDLTHFDAIVPCGISDADVTSVVKHLDASKRLGQGTNRHVDDDAALLKEYSVALQQAFEQVFDAQLIMSCEAPW